MSLWSTPIPIPRSSITVTTIERCLKFMTFMSIC
jgi:hypothetical protein